ncbi:MAG: hypothetical protein CVT48_01975 [Thermoplasmata archaeon HGW-Thermoplasmata-1]|nr:MAG: hypothetical protein CVT48_01975 [Thermoplasmata archaeon HGW-Thermoplasmata-1]
MELTRIRGVGPTIAEKLTDAGIASVEDARKMDIGKTAAKTGLKEERLKKFKSLAMGLHVLSDLKGIGATYEEKLAKAGVCEIHELAAADIKSLAKKSSITEESLQKWSREAKNLIVKDHAIEGATAVQDAAKSAGKAIKKGAEKMGETAKTGAAVVKKKAVIIHDKMRLNAQNTAIHLKEGAKNANVKIQESWHRDIPILRENFEGAETKIRDFGRDVGVYMEEGADRAKVWFEEQWHNDIPIIKEKAQGFFAKIKNKLAKHE